MTNQDKQTLQKALAFMQRNDPNGEYNLYLEDIENGVLQLAEVVVILCGILKQWRVDLANWRDPKYRTISKLEFSLIAMI